MKCENKIKWLTHNRTRILSLASSSPSSVLTPGSTPTSKSTMVGCLMDSTLTCNSLQYQNRKAEYFKAIWDIVNWKAVEKRFS